jgi:hypothetical protein
MAPLAALLALLPARSNLALQKLAIPQRNIKRIALHNFHNIQNAHWYIIT